MVGLFGRLVDRANAELVHLRAGRDTLVPDRSAVSDALHTLPTDLFVRDHGAVVPVRPAARGTVEHWVARDSDWAATRARSSSLLYSGVSLIKTMR